MPRKAEWIHRIDAALEELALLEAPMLDRAALQRLLSLSPRQAVRVLHELGAASAGKSLLIGRRELIERLTRMRDGEGGVGRERRRRERVVAELTRLRKQMAARRVALPVTEGVLSRQLEGLPPGIRLAPGKLEITFTSGEQLLGQLFELAQAAANDLDRFLEHTGGGKAQGR